MENQTLKLNEDEQNMVYRLRRLENQWRSWRKWVLLIFGIVELILGYLVAVVVGRNGSLTWHALLFVGVLSCFIAVRDWNGNIGRTLLLKLIDSSAEPRNPPLLDKPD